MSAGRGTERTEKLGPEHWINREFSWIAFNNRVLAQAEDIELPLLDRVKFLAIASSNMDEFFMVRMSSVRRLLKAGSADAGPDGATQRQVLEKAREECRDLLDRAGRCWTGDILPALGASGIRILKPADFLPDDGEFAAGYFHEQILPILTPMAVDTRHPFPLISTGAIYILLRVSARPGMDGTFFGKSETVLVQVPQGLNRFIPLPSQEGERRFCLLEDIVVLFAGELLRGYEIKGAHPFAITRDAEITLDEDQEEEDLIMALREGLRRSRWGAPVRLSVDAGVPEGEAEYLRGELELDAEDVFRSGGLMDMKGLSGLAALLNRPDLAEPPWPPCPHPAFSGDCDVFAVLDRSDVVVSLPYQSFDPVEKLVEQAANDPDVLAIKITLYRVSGESPIVRSLIRAAERKKQVTAVVELQARFDEETNIAWAQRLDAAGAHVIYGVAGYKTHSKAVLVIRRGDGGVQRYCHLSTGNYNDKTARQYTDLGLFTADPAFGADISAFFNVITGYSLPPVWNRIEMAPTGLRARTAAMIRREAEKHSPEKPGLIRAKMNALVDPRIIRELYRASQAGVRIDLLVRGMCRLRPGIPGLSETISVRSIVDRYLEHPRIFHYHNGGNDEVYLSSADWMERNLDRRLELLFPVIDPDCRRDVLAVLDAGFEDNTSAWRLMPDGTYVRERPARNDEPRRSQQRLYERALLMSRKGRDGKRHEALRARRSPGPGRKK